MAVNTRPDFSRNSNTPKRVLYGWFFYSAAVSIVTYLFDLAAMFSLAAELPQMVFMYFILTFVLKIFMTLPGIVIYFFLVRRIRGKLIWKALLFVSIIILLELVFNHRAWHIAMVKASQLREILAYVVSAVLTVLVDERYVVPKIELQNYR